MMKKIFYPFFILLMSCQNGQMSEDAHQSVVDSLNNDIKDKNRILNSLEYDVEFQDSLNNEYALYIQKIKDNYQDYVDKIDNLYLGSDRCSEDYFRIINSI